MDRAPVDFIPLLLEKYRSLTQPDYRFVYEVLEQEPYRAVIAQLRTRFDIDEDTDVNVDVSFGYALRRSGRLWGLQLSMVGPFAVFWRVVDAEHLMPIGPDDCDVSTDEQFVRQILNENHISLLDPAILKERVPFRRVNEDEPSSTLYQCLFTDLDWLPWD